MTENVSYFKDINFNNDFENFIGLTESGQNKAAIQIWSGVWAK